MKSLKESLLDKDFDANIPSNFEGADELINILLDYEWKKVRSASGTTTMAADDQAKCFNRVKEYFKKLNLRNKRGYLEYFIRESGGLDYVRIEKPIKKIPGAIQMDVYTFEGWTRWGTHLYKGPGNKMPELSDAPSGYVPAEIVDLLEYFLNNIAK